MIEIVRYTQRNVKRWQDGDMRKRWTTAGMLVAEQQFRRIIGYRELATLVMAIERHAHHNAPNDQLPQQAAEVVTVWPSTRGSPSKFHDDPDILGVNLAALVGCDLDNGHLRETVFVSLVTSEAGAQMNWPRFLTPSTDPQLRPDPNDPAQHEAVMYVRSILWMRIGVGLAGVLLPFALWLVDKYWFHGDPHPRDSMSAYYWSGMREVFVTVIFGTGAFLVGYKIAEVTLDNTASIFAGLGALCLAWFPTKPGCDTPITASTCTHVPLPVLTPLQEHWTPSTVWWFHLGGTFAFVSGLAIVSWLFGVREGKWPSAPGKRSPVFWGLYHKGLAVVMVGGMAWILVSSIPHHRFGPSWDVLIGEVTCVLAFGASWLLKGWEWDTLFGRPVEARRNSTWEGNPPPP